MICLHTKWNMCLGAVNKIDTRKAKVALLLFASIAFYGEFSSAQVGSCRRIFINPERKIAATLRVSGVEIEGSIAAVEYVPDQRQPDEPTKWFREDELLPSITDPKRLVIAIDKGHPYIVYRGFRIEVPGKGNGTIGYKIGAKKTRENFIYGNLFFVVHDLPSSVVEKLDAMIEDFEKVSRVNCVAVTCTYLNMVDSELVSNPNLQFPTSLIKELLNAKLRGNRNIEVVVIDNYTFEKYEKSGYNRIYKYSTRFEDVGLIGVYGVSYSPFIGGVAALLYGLFSMIPH